MSAALSCTRTGSGPDVVLVHGWGWHAGVWRDLVARLAPDFRVTAVDLPGCGANRALPARYTLDALAAALLDTVMQPAVFVGWSLGALVVLSAARALPARVRKQVLVGATPCFVQAPGWPHAMAAATLAEFGAELARDAQATLRRFLALQAGATPAARDALRTLHVELARAPAPAQGALVAGLDLLARTDLRAHLAEIRVPTLAIHGARDRLVPPAAARWLAAQLPAARLVEIADAGHVPFLSHPDIFARQLSGFL